jgi:hypothetical protein
MTLQQPDTTHRRTHEFVRQSMFIGVAVLAGALGPVQAQTDHSGTCTGVFAAAGNPHRLAANCTVPAGETLTIEPGVVFEGDNNRILTVQGNLNAAGVTFEGIRIRYEAGSGGTVENGTVTAQVNSFTIAGGMPRIEGNTIAMTTTFGLAPVDVLGTSMPEIRGNTISSPRSAIRCRDASGPTIEANTIASVIVGIEVSNSSTPAIHGNEILFERGAGVSYEDNGAGELRDNEIRPSPSGFGLRSAIQIQEAASPLITGNLFGDDPARTDAPVRVLAGTTGRATITMNRICATGDDRLFDLPVSFFEPANQVSIRDNEFPCGPADGIGLQLGTVAGAATLAEVNGIRRFAPLSTITVAAGAALTIPDGVSVRARGNTLRILGSLDLEGGSFTNMRFDLDPGSRATIRNGTFSSPENFASTTFDLNGADVTFAGNLVEGSDRAVFTVEGNSILAVRDSAFRANSTVFDLSSGASANVTISNNVFDANQRSLFFGTNAEALLIAFPSDFGNNVFDGRADENVIPLPGSVNRTGTLRGVPPAYFCDRSTTVQSSITLTLEPGTAILGNTSCSFTVLGDLIAAGTPERPVVFGSTRPESGVNWRGLTVRNRAAGAPTRLENCIIQFSGQTNAPGLRLDNASIPVRDCVIADNRANGIELINGSAPTITGTAIVQNLNHGLLVTSGSLPVVNRGAIFGNGRNGIQNDTTTVINAENNFWGDDSGPQNAAGDMRCNTLSNSFGLGEEVSDCVDFDPWLRLGPSVAGTVRVAGGNRQQGQVGTVLPQPLEVEVLSVLGTPLQGVDVTFSIVEGAATLVESQPVTTGADGRASATVRLGPVPGDVLIAVGARDVKSPLATFVGEANGPCLVSLASVLAPGAACPGDCGGDGAVSVDELIVGVRIALGEAPPSECSAFDRDGNGSVGVDELVTAVHMTIRGCP